METIYLQRQNEDIPWGFRLQGGADFKLPLTVQRVTSGSIAANGVCAGDVIARIGEAETASMSHTQAMQAIKNSGNVLQLGISRSGGMNGYSPSVPAISQQPASHPYSSTTPSANSSFQAPDFSMHDLYEDLNGVQTAPQPDPCTRYHPDNTIPNQPLNQFETRNSFPDSFENSYNSNDSWPRPGPAYDHGPAYSPAVAGSMATPKAIVSDNDSWKQPGPTFDHSPAYASSPAGSIATPQLVVSDGEAWRNETSNGPQCSPAPPPPPLPPMNALPTWNNQNGGNTFKKPATRLEQQISGDYPFGASPVVYGSDFEHDSPATPGGDLSSGIGTDYGDYDSSAYSSEISPQQPMSPPQPRMPDAILNMAAKGEASKKPFAYVADINDIREARDKVKKKNASSLPRYQHMLNMPQFEDPPRARGLPKTPLVAAQPNSQDSGEAVVANLQFNSPLQMYSSDNVVEALKGQSGGVVKDVIGLQKKEKNDITQSAVYKMIHGLDQQKPKPVVSFVESRPPERDQVGGSEIDTTSIRHVAEDDPDQVGQYEQKSIRYTGRNIPSKSFRLLQSMTGGGDATPPPVNRHIREPSTDDELRFSGLNKTGRDRAIPSKTFQLLHQKTATLPDGSGYGSGHGSGGEGGSEIDRTSIRHNVLGVPEEPGDYDQTSIRYTGKNNPSKSFRMLQSMTGGAGADDSPTSSSPVTVQGGRRQQVRKQQPAHVQHRPEPEGEKQNPDDVVDIRYVGGSIPSQSFRMLQQFVGTSNSDGTDGSAGAPTGGSTGDTLPSSEGRRVKVVRLRQQSSMEHTGSTEF